MGSTKFAKPTRAAGCEFEAFSPGLTMDRDGVLFWPCDHYTSWPLGWDLAFGNVFEFPVAQSYQLPVRIHELTTILRLFGRYNQRSGNLWYSPC
ncbi:MAG: hypothetical protein NXH89_04775 [Cyclobacteriaceae bacterium]|nr:hypothetical protein [Cyclobacteriaceae bacterium]